MLENKRILVVEDEKDLQGIYITELISRGALPAIANNAKEAIEKLKSEAFDYMILDLVMPVLSGENMFLQTDVKLPPTIIVTGIPDINKLDIPGHISVVYKPFEFDVLAAKLAMIV